MKTIKQFKRKLKLCVFFAAQTKNKNAKLVSEKKSGDISYKH